MDWKRRRSNWAIITSLERNETYESKHIDPLPPVTLQSGRWTLDFALLSNEESGYIH